MKFVSTIVMFSVGLAAQTALAGREGGNGGGTVVCRDSGSRILSVELLDFYEARTLRGVETDIHSLPGNWQQKASAIIDRVRTKSEFRYQLYSKWLGTFEKDSKLLTGVQFSTVPDSGWIALPKGCGFEQAAIQRQPIFPGDARYFLNEELWSAMDEDQRAGLALHEIVYREAIGYGHDTSIRSRYLVATYASPGFATLGESDYWGLLADANFETTDKPLPVAAGTVETQIDISRLTQPGPSDPKWSVLTLKDHVLVQLGSCDAGCAHFAQDPSARVIHSDGVYFTLARDTRSVTLKGSEPSSDTLLSEVGLKSLAVSTDRAGNAQIYVTANLTIPGAKPFSIHQKRRDSSVAGVGPSSVYTFWVTQLKGRAWQWELYRGNALSIVAGDSTGQAPNLPFVSPPFLGSCDLPEIRFENDRPVSLKRVSSLSLAICNYVPRTEPMLVGSLYSNGFGRTLFDSVQVNGVVSYSDSPYFPSTPFKDLYTWTSIGWSYDPGLVVCGETRLQTRDSTPAPCLRVTADANHQVSSLTVVDHSPKVWVEQTEVAYAQVGSSIQVEAVRGTVTSFVSRDPISWKKSTGTVIIPPGSTVELKETAIVGYH